MVVTHEDLVGEISNFPLHVVQMMVNNQVAQGNTANVKIFQNKKDTSKRFGGFDWSKTPQGTKYWNKAINFGCFGDDPCLPSKEVVTNESPKYKFGDKVSFKKGNRTIEQVVIAYVPNCPNPIWCVNNETFLNMMRGFSIYGTLNCREEGKSLVYLTMEDISKGKGVGIDPSLIRIVNEKGA